MAGGDDNAAAIRPGVVCNGRRDRSENYPAAKSGWPRRGKKERNCPTTCCCCCCRWVRCQPGGTTIPRRVIHKGMCAVRYRARRTRARAHPAPPTPRPLSPKIMDWASYCSTQGHHQPKQRHHHLHCYYCRYSCRRSANTPTHPPLTTTRSQRQARAQPAARAAGRHLPRAAPPLPWGTWGTGS